MPRFGAGWTVKFCLWANRGQLERAQRNARCGPAPSAANGFPNAAPARGIVRTLLIKPGDTFAEAGDGRAKNREKEVEELMWAKKGQGSCRGLVRQIGRGRARSSGWSARSGVKAGPCFDSVEKCVADLKASFDKGYMMREWARVAKQRCRENVGGPCYTWRTYSDEFALGRVNR